MQTQSLPRGLKPNSLLFTRPFKSPDSHSFRPLDPWLVGAEAVAFSMHGQISLLLLQVTLKSPLFYLITRGNQ